MKKKITLNSIIILLLLSPFHCLFAEQINNNEIIKILAIGNSFSEDAIENYLYDLAKESGKTIIIGNLYIPGCSLETHLNNIRENKNDYSYRKVDMNGNKTTTENYSISDALKDEGWDYISMQQASHFSGQYGTYQESLPKLFELVKKENPNKDSKYMFHQTWAYQQDSDHGGFPNYQNSQTVMYYSIMNASSKIPELINIDFIIPSGTAIQNARSSLLGDHLCRDGYHLDLDYGRFTAACTWFETIFGIDARTNTYTPSGISKIDGDIAKNAAHWAIINPFDVTALVNFE